jgi:signal transduction histidine kinase
MNLFTIGSLSVGISCAVLSLITLFFGKTKLHRLLLYFNVALAVWGFGLALVGIADTEAKALEAWKVAHFGGYFVAPLFYHLVGHFCGSTRNKILFFAYLQALFLFIASTGTELVINKAGYAFGLFYNIATPIFALGVAIFIFLVTLSYHDLFRFLKKTRGRKRLQTQHIIIGFFIGFTGGGSIFIPMFEIYLFYPIGHFGVTLYAFIVTYAILRHRLMDIHLIFRRTMVYSLSAGLLTGLFVVLVLIMTSYISNFTGHSSLSISIIAALIIAILFNPLKNRLQLFIDKVFYKSSYDYYFTIKKASSDLVKLINAKDIQRYMLDMLVETLKIKSAYFLSADGNCFKGEYFGPLNFKQRTESILRIDNDSELVSFLNFKKNIIIKEELPDTVKKDKINILTEELKPFKGEVASPIFIENKLAFILILGEKLSGDIYSDKDINLLSTISNQAAISLKNAMLYGELESRVRERTAELASAKNEIEAWNKELEKRVKGKTRELVKSQEQLIHSEKFSAMGHMAGGLAHELNSPLAGLLPMIEKYRDNVEKDSEGYNEFSHMLKACMHMAKIVKDFGSFSRESKGEFSELNLNEVIEDTLSFSSARLKQRRIKIIKEYEDKLPNVMGDKTGLQQVVLNILTNSRDAMSEGDSLTIKTTACEEKRHVSMQFIDTGTGIESKIINKIFNPFFTTKRPGEGTGLGLSVSYGIITHHKGKIFVESEPGKGATFTIHLPALTSNSTINTSQDMGGNTALKKNSM